MLCESTKSLTIIFNARRIFIAACAVTIDYLSQNFHEFRHFCNSAAVVVASRSVEQEKFYSVALSNLTSFD